MRIEKYLLPGRTAAETVAQLQMERLTEPTSNFKLYMINLDNRSKETAIHLAEHHLTSN